MRLTASPTKIVSAFEMARIDNYGRVNVTLSNGHALRPGASVAYAGPLSEDLWASGEGAEINVTISHISAEQRQQLERRLQAERGR